MCLGLARTLKPTFRITELALLLVQALVPPGYRDYIFRILQDGPRCKYFYPFQ